jgi:hypothetical protein
LRLAGERLAQEIRRLLDGAARRGRVGERVQHDEIMDRAEVARRSDPHAAADQLPGVGLALVTQHVVLVGNHQRRGQAPQLLGGGVQRRDVDVLVGSSPTVGRSTPDPITPADAT